MAIRIFLIVFSLSLSACLSERKGASVQTEEPDGPVNPIDGGAITGPNIPEKAVGTSMGGYITRESVVSYELDEELKLIAVTDSPSGDYFIFEEDVNLDVKRWQIHKLAKDSEGPVYVCGMVRPISPVARFSVPTYTSDGFKMFVAYTGYPSWGRIYDFDLEACQLGSYTTLYTNFASYRLPSLLQVSGDYYFHTYGSEMRVWDSSTGNSWIWEYSEESIGYAKPNPIRTSFSVSGQGGVWFFDTSERLWLGDESGEWLGFAKFDYKEYPNLGDTRYILSRHGGFRLVSYNDRLGTLMIHELDVSNFGLD